MIIKTIILKGLWGTCNVRWKLTSEVSILSGINGSGKSTLLRAMAALLVDDVNPGNCIRRFKSLELELTDGTLLSLRPLPSDINEIRKQGEHNPDFKKLVEDLEKEAKSKGGINSISGVSITALKDGCKINPEEAVKGIDCAFISTFDSAPPRPADAQELLKIVFSASMSDLDRHLQRIVERYRSYQIELGTRVSKLVGGENPDIEAAKGIYEARTQFQQLFDEMLHETGKQFNRDSGEVEFIFDADETSHPYTHLSAGEKQLLLILLTVFMQERRPAVLLMDEPEVSLHIDWQEKLIEVIRKINPNCQVILATHSPSILLDGWMTNVTNIQDITESSI